MSGILFRRCEKRFPRGPCTLKPAARFAHQRLTGKPTFVKSNKEEDSITYPLVGFAGAFGLTVGALYYRHATRDSSSELRPGRYGVFEVLEARKTTSPSQQASDDKEHIYLRIQAPLSREAGMLASQPTKVDVVSISSVFMKEPSLQIERPYTPLYQDALNGSGEPVELLVKQYTDGELGRYAHRLEASSSVELRGPNITWQGSIPNHFVLLVGGTGVIPAYQLMNTVITRSSLAGVPMPKFTVIYGARNPSSILLLPELAALRQQFPQQIDVRLMVDEIDAKTKAGISWADWLLRRPTLAEGMALQQGRMTEDEIRSVLREKPDISRKILVCGPDGMVEAIAGPKQGKLQGRLGGILGKLDCKEDEVWKL